ncbi:MAG: DNA recombination protein RmuC [Betaproteobacteria bacterium]|nr:DNA recombination protein RmuC [Betaproteobacteria bacterium]
MSEVLLLVAVVAAIATLAGVWLLFAAQRGQRQELADASARASQAQMNQLSAVASVQNNQIDAFSRQLQEMQGAVEARLDAIRRENTEQLEKIRVTVDEKLQATLEARLGESFKQVADRLEQVHKGLGEMQTLAAGVGDLKRVLTNVKSRGTWGEVQLEALLEQTLTREQFEKNVATKAGSRDRVEFAIRLPGREGQGQVWLPVDSKFPVEDYERLVLAAERADPQAVEEASKALESRLKLEARSIHDKYVDPPATTDFAILFLPTEGLYAEALRRPGLADTLQREYRVSLAGPTTLAALLNSLQMGFRTLAIEKRSSEVWVVLGAVKTEFAKFGEVLAATKRQLQAVTNSIEAAEQRTRAMDRKLKDVEALPGPATRGPSGEDRTPPGNPDGPISSP